MDLVELFDSIVIINVSHRTDRRQEMRSMLHRVGWDPDGPRVIWFPAIDPKTAAGFHSPATRGCFLSHVAVLNIARNAGRRRVLIMEDDCEFAADFPARQAEVADWLQSTAWGIAFLAHGESIAGPPRPVSWGPEKSVLLMHCYAVAGDVLARLCGYLEAIILRPPGSAEAGPMPVDGAFSWFRRDNPDVETVLVAPSLACQRPSRSDIAPKWFDRVPVIREAAENVRAWRR